MAERLTSFSGLPVRVVSIWLRSTFSAGATTRLSDYNTTRAAYVLPRVTTFAEITSNADLQSELLSLYGNVDSIGLWVGGLAEDHVAGASVGPTFRKIMADQFERVRDGDHMW